MHMLSYSCIFVPKSLDAGEFRNQVKILQEQGTGIPIHDEQYQFYDKIHWAIQSCISIGRHVAWSTQARKFTKDQVVVSDAHKLATVRALNAEKRSI